MSDQWYYAQQGQRQGPVSEEQLKQLAFLGQLKPSDKVWKKGMAAWQAASEVEGMIPPPAEDEPPPIPSETEPPPIPQQALPPPVPWTHTAREFLGYMLQSPLTVIGIALIASAFLPFLLCLHFSMAGILGLLQNGFVLVAAVLTFQKKDYRVAVVASLLVLFGWLWMPAGTLKVISAVIALPIGVWSFLTLRKPELRQQFVNHNDPVAPAIQRIVTKLKLQPTPQNASRVELATMGGVYTLAVILAVFVGHSTTSTAAHNEPSSRIIGTWIKGSLSLQFTPGGSAVASDGGREEVMKYSLTDNSLTFHETVITGGGMRKDGTPVPTTSKEEVAVIPVEFTSDDEMVLGKPDHGDRTDHVGIWRRQRDEKGAMAIPNRADTTSGHEDTESGNERGTASTSGHDEIDAASNNPNYLKGKSQEEVVAALGKPDSVFTGGTLASRLDDEVWSYHDRVRHKVTGTLQTIQVHFSHSRVVLVGLD